MKQDRVVKSIKGGRYIKKAKARDLMLKDGWR